MSRRRLVAVHIDKLRKLAAQPGVDPIFAQIVADYDEIKARGEIPAIWMDGGHLVVGSLVPVPVTEH